jgi:hypothetical protein
MFVRRSDEICFRSIQRDRTVTGANAMLASLAGSATASPLLRTKLSRAGPGLAAVNTGFQRVAGATSGSSAIFFGPVLRSRSGAIDRRQLSAAISRSPAVIVTCASFSASANVEAATGGPDAGDVPKVGGAPGVAGGGGGPPAAGGWSRQATAAATTPSGADIRNCLRVFIGIVSGRGSEWGQSVAERDRPQTPSCTVSSRE